MNYVAHKIGEDGWPDAIWQGVNEHKVILHLGRDHHKRPVGYVDVRSPDGTMRGFVGDLIIRTSDDHFMILRQPANPPPSPL